MSILIKGINMPKEPWECPCHDGENGRCKVTQNMCYEIPKDCPLVAVPTPHGRLIDADQQLKVCMDLVTCVLFPMDSIEEAEVIGMVQNAPTIIESEE